MPQPVTPGQLTAVVKQLVRLILIQRASIDALRSALYNPTDEPLELKLKGAEAIAQADLQKWLQQLETLPEIIDADSLPSLLQVVDETIQ
jgi:hypothetical protein